MPEEEKKDRVKSIFQFLKFTMFSASAGIIETGLFSLLSSVFHLKYWPSYLPALIASVLWNFTLNRKFTFKAANNVPVALMKVTVYYLIFTPLSTWWGNALTEGLHWNYYVVFVGTLLINFITEFLYSKFYTFRDVFIFPFTKSYVAKWETRRALKREMAAKGTSEAE
ncbi:MAG: GtrA family protein [Bacteroidales bacterium]|jgi:putative flippase GtrA|nr:GtrA family protein [Bacteroidales bacterium]MCI2121341.1 GtrA family protein [Bacteroidales bacterium]MCI2145908.1 GtrA family protein [Bacteroidales bacterium]